MTCTLGFIKFDLREEVLKNLTSSESADFKSPTSGAGVNALKKLILQINNKISPRGGLALERWRRDCLGQYVADRKGFPL